MKITPLSLSVIGLITLPLQSFAQDLVEGDELLPLESEWEYLYYSDSAFTPLDPATANPAFHTTWHTPSTYSGTPAFRSGMAMLGWGEVPDAPNNLINTNIWGNRNGMDVPPSGNRFTCYLRTTFTPPSEVSEIRFKSRIDDGAIFYLNGVEVARVRVDATGDATDWMQLASSNGNENNDIVTDVTLTPPLPANVLVDLAVSLHNRNATSSDIGFDTQVVPLVPSPPMPAPNDDFADAEVLTDPIPFTVTGRNDNRMGGLGATLEANEPAHAGDTGGGSVWYSWTPTQSNRVSIATGGSTFDTVLGVYTGTSVGALSEVASSDDATFFAGSRAVFDAQAGTTYLIAVDGNAAEFGAITLNFANAPEPFVRTEELIAAGSNWDYLVANNTVRTVDPDSTDADFYSTWQTVAGYDGPPFSNGPALLGYGTIEGDPVVTTVFGAEDEDNRNAALYLRNTFTPTAATTNLAFYGLIDDGAIVYIDGVEVTRINVSPAANADSFRSTALGPNPGGMSNESFPQLGLVALELPAGTPVELAISVHNASATSSDLGFDIEVFSTTTPPPPSENFVAFIAPTATAGEFEISWVSQIGAVYDLEFSPDLQSWTPVTTDIPGTATGTNSAFDTPPTIDGFYRVVRQ